MARNLRNPKLDTRSARAKLTPRREPYWAALAPGRHLGYRRLGHQGGTWVAKLRDPAVGGRLLKALGTADDVLDAGGSVLTFACAQERARAWFVEAEKAAGDAADGDEGAASSGPYTVADAAHDYLAWYARHRKALRETMYAVNTHVLSALGDLPLDRLTARRVRAWHNALAEAPARLRSARGAAPRFRATDPDDAEAARRRRSTANRVLTVLKAVLNRAHAEGRIASDDAWRRVKPFPQADAARERRLSEAECRRLLDACPPDLRRLAHAALLTGARYGELCRLEVRDLDPEARTLLVRLSKAGRPRHLPLDDDAASFFAAVAGGRPHGERLLLRAGGRPWAKSHQTRPLAEACRVAAIDPLVTFHGLRHTWASHAVTRGAHLMVVAHVLGHADTRMVERHYGHLAPSHVRDVLAGKGLRLGDAAAAEGTAAA